MEIGNTTVWVLLNIWRLGQVSDNKFGINVSNKILLNAAKCQGYSSYHFWVIQGKPTGMGVKLPPTQIRVNERLPDKSKMANDPKGCSLSVVPANCTVKMSS